MSAPLELCTRVTILALEPDPHRVPAIRRIARSSPRVDITICRSKRELLEALGSAVPDVILLPPLLLPADEAELVAQLRSRVDATHVELLVTPFVMPTNHTTSDATSGERRWWRRKPAHRESGACASRELAEQLTCALHRARELRAEGTGRTRLWDESGTGGCDRLIATYASISREPVRFEPSPLSSVARIESRPQPTWPSSTHLARADRRAYRRIPASELRGLRAARLQDGPLVTLVDFSAGGVLLESAITLRPASGVVLELCGETGEAAVPIRVVRCQSSSTPSLYLGACAFREPLDLTALLRVDPSSAKRSGSPLDGFDQQVKAIVEEYQREATAAHAPRGSEAHRVAAALRKLNDANRFDPGADAFRDLVKFTIAALEEREEPDATLTRIEHRLDATLPGLTARFGVTPALSLGADNESLYFEVPRRRDSDTQVLNVEVQQRTTMEDWQFRLLKASAYLAALLPDVGRQASCRQRFVNHVPGGS